MLLASPGDSACRTVMKESLETVFFLHFTSIYATFAFRASMVTESKNPKDQCGNPHKNAKIGNIDPIADANGNSQNWNAAKLNPRRQIWEIFDKIISPLLILFASVFRFGLKLENDPFHMTTRTLGLTYSRRAGG
jgi:hypothetical protein